MKKLVGLIAIAGLTFSLSACSASKEDVCKEWLSKYMDEYMVAVLDGDPSAESNFANGLRELAKKAPQEIADAMNADAMNVGNSYETATICKEFMK